MEFHPESVVLGCGPDAARAYPYTVIADGRQVGVKVDAPNHPLMLALKPNNTLDPGSGFYLVEGRRITGQNGNDDFTFAPVNATCALALLSPGAVPSVAVISARYNNQPLFWGFHVNLKPGQNAVTLDQRNAIPLN